MGLIFDRYENTKKGFQLTALENVPLNKLESLIEDYRAEFNSILDQWEDKGEGPTFLVFAIETLTDSYFRYKRRILVAKDKGELKGDNFAKENKKIVSRLLSFREAIEDVAEAMEPREQFLEASKVYDTAAAISKGLNEDVTIVKEFETDSLRCYQEFLKRHPEAKK